MIWLCEPVRYNMLTILMCLSLNRLLVREVMCEPVRFNMFTIRMCLSMIWMFVREVLCKPVRYNMFTIHVRIYLSLIWLCKPVRFNKFTIRMCLSIICLCEPVRYNMFTIRMCLYMIRVCEPVRFIMFTIHKCLSLIWLFVREVLCEPVRDLPRCRPGMVARRMYVDSMDFNDKSYYAVSMYYVIVNQNKVPVKPKDDLKD